MNQDKKLRSALISVYHKDHLEPIILRLHQLGVKLFATGGTQEFIEQLKVPVIAVESLTDYPSILGGRVKTLHPKIFGGILSRRENSSDVMQLEEYHIPEIDLVIVDLYPFEKAAEEESANGGKSPSFGGVGEAVIEKIDIGGISLIRAAAKNFQDVLIIPSHDQYEFLLDVLQNKNGTTSLDDRKLMATHAFNISSHYDAAIFRYFNNGKLNVFKQSIPSSRTLRYGENPHQQGVFYGKLDEVFEQLHGKEISYNNLLDMDAAVSLMNDFDEPTFAIIKHNNACGVASRENISDAWNAALSADPISAFGGILISNKNIDAVVAIEINKLFFEILIAPSYDEKALEILKQKKNRIILVQKNFIFPPKQFRSLLNGVAEQDRDLKTEAVSDLKTVTTTSPDEMQKQDLLFANKIVKHSKSNTIVIAHNKQLLASGTGQTSRVDALQQAIAKASRNFGIGFNLNGAVMASDAFFPFPDCVEIADKAGIKAIIQPGGSVKDQDSIDYCNQHGLAMVMTGFRHFKH